MAAKRKGVTMTGNEWVEAEVDKLHAESVRFLKIAHSRIDKLRSLVKSFGKAALAKRLRDAKKQAREVQKTISVLPPNLGKAVLAKGPIRLLKKEEASQLNLFPFYKVSPQ